MRWLVISKKVIKTTATQFTVEGGTRFKKDGRQIGDRFKNARALGEIYYGNNAVKDETQEKIAFSNKIALERNISKELESLKMPINSPLSQVQLEQVQSKIEEVKKLIATE